MHKSRTFWLALAALGISGLHFTFVYVFAALACARGFADQRILSIDIIPVVGCLASVVGLVSVSAFLLFRSPESTEADAVSTWLLHGCIAVSMTTIILVTLPFAFVATCA